MNTDTVKKDNGNLPVFSVMQRTLFALKNWKKYKYWRARVNGKKFREFDRGAGYYITLGLFGYNPVGEMWESKMQSGKTGIYELIAYEAYRDPHDMVKHGWYSFVGYVGEKPIPKCTFEEFISLYAA